MRGAFDDDDFERGPNQRDTELTLGAGLLAGIGVGLLALCGVCFVIGYAVGRRAPIVDVKPTPEAIVLANGGGGNGVAKPSATQAIAPAPSPASTEIPGTTAAVGQPSALTPMSTPAMVAPSVSAPPTVPSPSSQPLVHPALPAQIYVTQSTATQPVLSVASGIMVQVAVVSQLQDADVLVAALRKRGYAAAVRHALSDSMLHVQVGPFTNRNDAMTTRQRLINDGYNAVVQ